MFVHIAGNESKSVITNLDEQLIQMNAVDLRISRVFAIDNCTPFVISEEGKTNRKIFEIQPDNDGYFRIAPDGVYQIEFDHEVSVANGECGWIIPRSTLNRNGLFLTSGLYDSGFSNFIGAVLHNRSGWAKIKVGTRVGQFLLANAETLKLYQGEYNAK